MSRNYFSYEPSHFFELRPEMFAERGWSQSHSIKQVRKLRTELLKEFTAGNICAGNLDNPLMDEDVRSYLKNETRRIAKVYGEYSPGVVHYYSRTAAKPFVASEAA